MHREIALAMIVDDVDHQDGDGLNNQRNNLRPATRQQNMRNGFKRAGCSSQFKGVCWAKREAKWVAKIRVNKRLLHLGYFIQEHLAAAAYSDAAKQFFGEFARTNYD